MNYNIKCRECSAYGDYHSIGCSKMTVEQRADQCQEYYNAWLRDHAFWHDTIVRTKAQIVLWQGKHAMLRHENNKLRNKLKKLGALK